MTAHPEPRDAPVLIRLFTDPEVRHFLGGPLSRAAAEERATGLIHGTDHGASVIREGRDAIGLIWLSPHHGGKDIELSYVLLPEWQGMGHASRACASALRHAFEVMGLPRVVSETQAANSKSVALLERLGMQPERRLERFGAEQVLYSIKRPDAD